MSTPSTRITFDRETELGRGAFGIVYLGEFIDGNEKKTVAVKRVLISERDGDYMLNLKREEEILFKLKNHSYIVRLYFVEVQQEEFRCYAMEQCDYSFDKLFPGDPKNLSRLPSTFTLLYQLAQGLEYIHSMKVVHRDIKPENALIKFGPLPTDCCVKWSDFGLSKSVTGELGSFTQSQIKGTKTWMAPEILIWLQELEMNSHNENAQKNFLKQRGNYSCDVFSAGCFFFYIVTHGVHPFGDDSTAQISNIKLLDLVHLDKLEKKNLFYELIMKMMKKQEERINMVEVVQEFNNLKEKAMKDELFNFLSKIEDIVDEEDILPHFRRLMAEDGINVNSVNSRGLTPLLLLCQSKHNRYKFIEELIKQHAADVNHQDNEGNNALFWLVRNCPNNFINVIHLLIGKGITVNHVDKNGDNFLAHLVSNYSEPDLVEVMKVLIEKGVDVKHKNDRNENILFHLVRNNNQKNQIVGIIEMLSQLGIDVNSINDKNENILFPLFLKYHQDDILDIARVLIGRDLSARQINTDGGNLLFNLVKNRFLKKRMVEIITFLVENGIDVQIENNDGVNFLFFLVSSYNEDNITEIIELLIKYRFDINLVNNEGNNILFHLMSISDFHSPENIFEITKVLTNHNIDLKLRDKEGNNLLLWLANYYKKENIIDLMKLLVESGIDVNLIDIKGENVLFCLIRNKNSSKHIIGISKLLKDNEFKINYMDKKGETVLFRLLNSYTEDNILEVIKVFIEMEITVNEHNQENEIALFYLLRNRQLPPSKVLGIIELLINNKSDVNCVAKDGDNFLFRLLSEYSKDNIIDIIRILINNRVNVKLLNKGENVIFRLISKYSGDDIMDIIRLFIQSGCKADHVDKYGEGTLFHLIDHYPKKNRIVEIMQYLIEHNANTKHVDKDGDNILFRLITNYSQDNIVEILSILIKKGAEVEHRDVRGNGLLFRLVGSYSGKKMIEIIQTLIDNNISLKQEDVNGDSILFYLISQNFSSEHVAIADIIDLIIMNSPLDVVKKTDEDGNNALLVRLIDRYTGNDIIDIINVLCKKIDVNQCNNKKENILFKLASCNRDDVEQIVQTLIKKKINVKQENNDGKNPIDCFKESYTNENLNRIVQLISAAG